MELIQFSTLTCPPCKMAKEYIERNFDTGLINYTFVPIEYLEDFDPKYKNILKTIKSRSVPIFVVMDEENMIYTFVGFNKQEITRYAEYVTKNAKNKIQDNIPEELEAKVINMQNSFIDDENDFEDNDFLLNPSINGINHLEDSDDDFIDDEDEEDFEEDEDLEDYID